MIIMELRNDPAWILNQFGMIPKLVLSIIVIRFMQPFFSVSKRCTCMPLSAHLDNGQKGGVAQSRLPRSEGADCGDILSKSCTLGCISILLLLRVVNVAPVSHCVENQLHLGPSDKNSSPLSSVFKRLQKASHLFAYFQCK